MLERFGKSADGILNVNQTFFSENAAYLEAARRTSTLYAKGPPRRLCKLCAAALPVSPLFRKLGVGYAVCEGCGHLNGLHEDDDSILAAVRAEESYAAYHASVDAAAFV